LSRLNPFIARRVRMKSLPKILVLSSILTLVGRGLAGPGDPPPESLLPGDTAECYAYYPQEDRCLATRGEMNRRMQGRVPDSLPPGQAARREFFASLRSSILADAAQQTFLASQAQKAPLRRDLEEDIRRGRAKWEASARKSAPDPVLRSLYQRYAEALFRLQPDARLEILAATDSGLIDSLWIQIRQGKRTAPWIPASLPLDKVPEAWMARIKTVEPGKWQNPFRMPYGFVLIRLVKKGNRAMPSLDEAAPALAFLAQQPSAPEAIPETRVREYYATHRGEFAPPDTIRLETGLLPLMLGKGSNRKSPAWKVDAAELPVEVRQALGAPSTLRQGDTLGTMRNPWGQWRLRVREIRHGRDSVPFADAARRIQAELRKQNDENALLAAQKWVAGKVSGKKQVLIQNALEEAYAPSAERMDSLARIADPALLASYGCPDRSDNCITGFKELESRRLARQAVDSLHSEWIRSHIRVKEVQTDPLRP
jgi:hypothetical protein